MVKHKLNKKELNEGAKLVDHYKKKYIAVNKTSRVIALSLLSALVIAGGATSGYFGYKYYHNNSPVTPTPTDDKVTVLFKNADGTLNERRIEKNKTFKEAGLSTPDNTYKHYVWGYTNKSGFVPFTDETKVEATVLLEEKSSIGYQITPAENQEIIVGKTIDVTAKILGKGFDLDDFEIVISETTGGSEFVGDPIYDYSNNTITRTLKITSASEECHLLAQIKNDSESKYYGAQTYDYSSYFLGVNQKSIHVSTDSEKWKFEDIKLKSNTFDLSNKDKASSIFTLEYDNDGEEKDINLAIESDEENSTFTIGKVHFESGVGKSVTLEIPRWRDLEDGTNYYLSGEEFKTVYIDYSKATDYLKENGITLDISESTTEIDNDNTEIELKYTFEGEESAYLTLGLYNEDDELIERFEDTYFYWGATEIYFSEFSKISNKEKLYLKQAPIEQKWSINYSNTGLSDKGITIYSLFCTSQISESSPTINLNYSCDEEKIITLGLYVSDESSDPVQTFNVTFAEAPGEGYVDLDDFTHFTDPEVLETESLYLKVVQ